MIELKELYRQVENGTIQSYTFDCRNDTGDDPYMQLELVFQDGTKLIVIPEGKAFDGLERIGLYFS